MRERGAGVDFAEEGEEMLRGGSERGFALGARESQRDGGLGERENTFVAPAARVGREGGIGGRGFRFAGGERSDERLKFAAHRGGAARGVEIEAEAAEAEPENLQTKGEAVVAGGGGDELLVPRAGVVEDDFPKAGGGTSIELAAVVRKAMARDPWGRYPNAAAMRDALISLRPAVGTQRRLTAVERPRTSETPTMGAVPSARGVAIPAQPALALEDIDRVLPPTRGPGARWSGAIGVVLVAVVISVAAWAATRSAVPVASLARDLQPARAVGPAVAPSAISTETPGTRLPPRAAVPAIEGVLPAGVDPPLSAEPTSVPRPARGALLRHTQLEPVVGGPVEQRSVEQDPVAPDEDGQNDDGREPGILNPFD